MRSISEFNLRTYKQIIANEARSLLLYRDALAEFIGTFVLVAVQSMLPLSWGDDRMGNVTQVGVGMGFVVCMMTVVFADFSGGHFNPAVSLAMAIALKISAFRAVIYIVAQCCGGMAGAGVVMVLTPKKYREDLAATTLHADVTPVQGVFIEVFITFILVIVIFGATNNSRKDDLFMPPIPIGFAFALGIMSAFRSTGGSMNPARSLGPAVMMGIWENHWVYWVGPFIGAILATSIYCFLLDRVELFNGIRAYGKSRDKKYKMAKIVTNFEKTPFTPAI